MLVSSKNINFRQMSKRPEENIAESFVNKESMRNFAAQFDCGI